MMRIQLFRVLYWTLAEIGSVGAPLVSAVSIVEAVSGSNNNKVATTATAENFAAIAHTGCDRAHPIDIQWPPTTVTPPFLRAYKP